VLLAAPGRKCRGRRGDHAVGDINNYAKLVMDYRQRLLLAALRQSQQPHAD
jgi:hypothetical protein